MTVRAVSGAVSGARRAVAPAAGGNKRKRDGESVSGSAAAGISVGSKNRSAELKQVRRAMDANLKQDRVSSDKLLKPESQELQAFAAASSPALREAEDSAAEPKPSIGLAKGIRGGGSAGSVPALEGEVGTRTETAEELRRRVGGEQESPLRDLIRDKIAEPLVKELARRAGVPIEDMRRPQPEEMKEGQVHTFEIGPKIGGEAEGIDAGAGYGLKMEVEKKDGKFLMRTNMGADVEVGADAVSTSTSNHIEVEHEFPDEESFKKGQIMMGVLARHPARCVVNGDRPATPAELEEASKYLDQFKSSVTIDGEGAVEAAKTVGIPLSDDITMSAAGVKLKGGRMDSMKINFKDGKPTTAEFSIAGKGETSLDKKVGISSDEGGFAVTTPVSKGELSVTRKITVDIPDGVTAEQLRKDPVGALRSRAEKIRESMKDERIVKLSVEHQGKGHDFEATFEPSDDPAKNREALKLIAQGKFDEANKIEGVDIKYKHERWEKKGIDIAPGLDLKVIKIGGRLKSETKTVVDRHEWPPAASAVGEAHASI